MLPNAIVIGAMKCGTLSLHYDPDLHPQIRMSKQKELNFFCEELNWPKGVAWYESQFSDNVVINAESCTEYTKFPRFRGVPQRMHSVIPGARLIFLVRDPVERIVSHYVHEYAQGRENRPIDKALETLEGNHYVDTSRYYLQLCQFLEFYPLDKVLLVKSEDLKHQRLQTLQTVFKFLAVARRLRVRRVRQASSSIGEQDPQEPDRTADIEDLGAPLPAPCRRSGERPEDLQSLVRRKSRATRHRQRGEAEARRTPARRRGESAAHNRHGTHRLERLRRPKRHRRTP